MLEYPQTVLSRAVHAGDNRAVKAAIKAGSDVNAADGGTTPINRAAFGGHTAVVKTLVAKGASVDGTDERGFFPLQLAASADHGTTVKALLALGAPANQVGANGGSALHAACAQGFAKAARALVAGGADLELVDSHGATPIVYAAIHGHKKVFALIQKAGAQTDRTDNSGKSLLMQLLASAYRYRVSHWRSEGTIRGRSVAYEIKDGSFSYYSGGTRGYIRSQDIKLIAGRHCPEHTRFLDRIDLARRLLRADADLAVRDNEGWTALLYCAQLGVDYINEFIKRGADVRDRTNDGRGVLHLMATSDGRCTGDQFRELEVVLKKTLKSKELGKDQRPLLDALNAPDSYGWIPLHYAAWLSGDRTKHGHLVRFCGAEFPHQNNRPDARAQQRTTAEWMDMPAGSTPGDIARARGFELTLHLA